MRTYTVGFTKKSASAFFEILRSSGARRVIDVRLNNVSQLAGFTKRDDLKFFLAELCGMDYVHDLRFAPTQPMLDAYKKHRSGWQHYEREFLDLMTDRKIEDTVSKELLDGAVLLCSEATAQHCHRRLVADYLAERWSDVSVTHL